ncbi:hypothetical protein D3C80_1247720 [compost metagenome]
MHGADGIDGELQTPGGQVLGDQLSQTRFVDRRLSFVEPRNALSIDVHAADRMAHLRQAHRLGQADVARSENRNFHACLAL